MSNILGFRILFIAGLFIVTCSQVRAQAALNFTNFKYGADPAQAMDVYLPAGRNLSTKIVLLIHGGGWAAGSKEQMNNYVTYFQTFFPQHAIVNINYRLGTIQSPGLYKQLEDIDAVVKHMKNVSPALNITAEFCFLGTSAGGHLSMLYGYAKDPSRSVKVIVNLFGPTSFGDPAFKQNVFFNAGGIKPLVGNYTYAENPYIYELASPINWVTANSTKTIGFFGDQDPLIPGSQGALLEDKLDSVGVYNKYYLYQGVGHGNFTAVALQHAATKIYYFVKNYL